MININKECFFFFEIPLKYSPSSTRDNVSISERFFVMSRIRSSSKEEFLFILDLYSIYKFTSKNKF